MLRGGIAAGIVGAVLGFLAGLGVGGGSLLVLWLTAVIRLDPRTAQGINLLFFLPGAAVSTFFRRKQGKLSGKTALPALAAGLPAAALCAFLGARLETDTLKQLFGVLLILAGVGEVFGGFRRKRPGRLSDLR